MATLKLLPADRTALADALADLWDDQSGACTIEFYTGAMPANVADAITTQTKLGTVTCSDPIGTAGSGALTFGSVTQDSAADASGTAAWARLLDGGGNPRAFFDVTNTAGTGAIKLNTTTIVAGGPIVINSFVITMGGA